MEDGDDLGAIHEWQLAAMRNPGSAKLAKAMQALGNSFELARPKLKMPDTLGNVGIGEYTIQEEP